MSSITSSPGTQTVPRPAPSIDPARLRAQKVRRKKITTWALVLTVIVAAAGAYLKYRAGSQTNPYADLQTAPVQVRDVDEIISATGNVTPETGAEVKIGSQISGRIKKLHADVGSKVKAGDVIAELDLPDVEAQVVQAEAGLAAAQDKLRQQQAGYGQVRTQSSSGVLQAKANLRSAQAKLASADAAANLQPTQTSSDIARAKAALSAAKSALTQVQTDAQLETSTAKAQVTQAQANALLAKHTAQRQQMLANQGYIAAQDAETAGTQEQVTASAVLSAQQNQNIVLAKVANDRQAAQDQVSQAEANLSAAQAETFQNTMKQADARSAQADVNQARSALAIARANVINDTLKVQDIRAAQDAVLQSKAQVAYQKAQFAKTTIATPISGTVIQLAQQQGETIAAGLSAPTVIIVADLNRLQVDAFVDETDIGKVKIGQPADVTVDAYPDEKFPGHVTKIASGSTIQQTVVTYDVTIALDHPTHGLLKPDMTANVNIHVGDHPQVVAVPNEAIKSAADGSSSVLMVTKAGQVHTAGAGAHGAFGHHRPGGFGHPGPGGPGGFGRGGPGGGPHYPVGPNGITIEPVSIVTGASDGSFTEVKSGLHAGETVVIAGAPSPDEGASHLQFTPFGARRVRGPRKKG